jgi:hypothetical protein
VTRGLVLVAISAATVAVFASPAAATSECRGFRVCVPVAGPWVVVPAGTGAPRPRVEYQLSCPKGYIVGGLDAELSDAAIDIAFYATLGTPVNPGISTSRAAVFVASYTGSRTQPVSFRPHIGCLPSSGGGRRVPTVARAVPPGHPSIRHVWTVNVRPASTEHVTKACATGETLLAASHAVGFYTQAPPSASEAAGVVVSQTVKKGRIAVSIRRGGATRTVRAVVQIDAVCAGGQ